MTTISNTPVTISQKPLCQPETIREEWDQVPVQKGWEQKVHAWMSFESAPAYGKKQNYCELTGVIILTPCSLFFSVFLIKHPEDVNPCVLVLQKTAAVFLIIVTLPITILGALLKGLGEILPHEKLECDDSSKTKAHPLIVKACYLMLKQFSEACEQIAFDRYYPIDGTLLGAVRHGGFIPWDDDVDLTVDVADMELLSDKLRPLLEAQGIVWNDGVYESFNVIKLSFNQESWKNLCEEYQKSPNSQPIPDDLLEDVPNIIDLCGSAIMSDGSWASASSAGRALFPTDYVPLENAQEISSPKQYIRFGDLLLPTFSNGTIIRFLKTYYGDDCLEHGLQTHSHGSINTCCGRLPIPKFQCAYRFKITGT